MSMHAIGAIGTVGVSANPSWVESAAGAYPMFRTSVSMPAHGTGADFAEAIGAGLSRVDGSLRAADAHLRAMAAGRNVPLHETMIAMEQARLDLTLAVEIRNRLVEAYQELTRMQL